MQTKSQQISESYISEISGTFGQCRLGVPISSSTRAALLRRGFKATEVGLEMAIRCGDCHVQVPSDESVRLLAGEAGIAAWRKAATKRPVSFSLMTTMEQISLACVRSDDGKFAVDALATDGGGIPRNNIISKGLALVSLGLWSLPDFVTKTSVIPAGVLGLAASKGQVRPGFDADLTVVDMSRREVLLTIVAGHPAYEFGRTNPNQSRIITTTVGEAAVRDVGLSPVVINEEELLMRA